MAESEQEDGLPTTLAKQYAEEHKTFLQSNQPQLLKSLHQSGDLPSYLQQTGMQAAEMHMHLMAQHLHSKEEQAKEYPDRIRSLQSRQQSVQEVVRDSLIHQPRPE